MTTSKQTDSQTPEGNVLLMCIISAHSIICGPSSSSSSQCWRLHFYPKPLYHIAFNKNLLLDTNNITVDAKMEAPYKNVIKGRNNAMKRPERHHSLWWAVWCRTVSHGDIHSVFSLPGSLETSVETEEAFIIRNSNYLLSSLVVG